MRISQMTILLALAKAIIFHRRDAEAVEKVIFTVLLNSGLRIGIR